MIRAHDVDLPAGRFHVLRDGPPGAPLAIVLHGFPDHPPNFEGVIRALAAAGYDVVAPWLRGYAPSPVEGPYDVEQLSQDVLDLATALGHERFVLVGHDWGAAITYATASRAPERVLAAVTMAVPHPLAFLRSWLRGGQLLRSWYMFFFQVPGVPQFLAASERTFLDRLWKAWSPSFTLPEHQRIALHRTLAASLPAPIEYYRAMMRPTRRALARLRASSPVAQPIRAPLLNLQGADDHCIRPSAARGEEKYFRGPFELAVVPDAGHFLHLEQPALVEPRIVGWLRAHAPCN